MITFDQMELVRSRRKTLSLQIKRDGRVVVRAPLRMPLADIRSFVESRSDWVEKHLAQMEECRRQNRWEPFSADEIARLTQEARRVIPQRVAYYAPLVGVSYGRVGIRHQKTLWGSCNARGNLSFNCVLMLAPPEVLDSVVVHELCHRKYLDHSSRFWAEVLRVYPNYAECRRWLLRNGRTLLARIP